MFGSLVMIASLAAGEAVGAQATATFGPGFDVIDRGGSVLSAIGTETTPGVANHSSEFFLGRLLRKTM